MVQADKKLFEHVVVLGLGALGGSVAKALHSFKLATKVSGYALPTDVELALADGTIDQACANDAELALAVATADCVVLALPVSQSIKKLSLIAQHLPINAVLTDVCSVKQGLIDCAQQTLQNRADQFVASHPIAGSHLSGYGAARADLFEGAMVIIEPARQTSLHAKSVANVSTLWRALGASVQTMDGSEHDKLYALISHLPHMTAYALMNAMIAQYGEMPPEKIARLMAPLIGGGFKDSTRIAGSSPALWADIAIANKVALSGAIKETILQLAHIDRALQSGEQQVLQDLLAPASQLRDLINKAQ